MASVKTQVAGDRMLLTDTLAFSFHSHGSVVTARVSSEYRSRISLKPEPDRSGSEQGSCVLRSQVNHVMTLVT